MRESGLFHHLIAEEYSRESLAKIEEILESHRIHEILPIARGLFTASPSQAPDSLTGYQNVWIRDNVMVANSFRLRGQLAPAIACMKGLTLLLETQRPRFHDIIADVTRALKEDANRRPHIRFTAQSLGELPEKWPHAQNDALGHALWFRFLLANEGSLPLTAEDYEVFRFFPDYFEAIDEDSGAWEEGRKVNNSSVGAVVAGLEELRRYFSASAPASAPGVVPISTGRAEKLEVLIQKGTERLASTLPFEGPPERRVDSALLLLLHPLNVISSRPMQGAILKLVQARLKGPYGIKRYAGDSYFCQDYDEWFSPSQMSSDFSDRQEFRDAFLQPNCEAQWCIFDPLLSIIYGQRFLADPTDKSSLARQVHYFNRSLAQITPDGKCPELYFLKQGRYVPNAHTPLAWTQANQALALHLVKKSVEVSPMKLFPNSKMLLLLCAVASLLPGAAVAQLKRESLAQTPPMGWNSWNKFQCNVSEELIKSVADSIATNGMKDAGYEYVVIDDCWQVDRDENGNIVADAKHFPSGIKALADYVHSKGLKFGMYSDAGTKTCAGRPASQGHEYQDALQYARWGVDYLKYDWCHTETRNAEEAYTTMSNALLSTGRPIVFSMCEWGTAKPWLWAKGIGNLWRTTGDISDHWEGKNKWPDGSCCSLGMVDIFEMQNGIETYAGPGHWNDPDMLEIGNGGMTNNEYQAHFSFWAMLAAPLMSGNDVRSMTPEIKEILTNKEVIAIDQDKPGRQGRRVSKNGDLEIWARPLSDGGRAVVLFNRGTTDSEINVTWEQIAYPNHLSARVRDLWAHKDLGAFTGGYSTKVAGHSAVMLKVLP